MFVIMGQDTLNPGRAQLPDSSIACRFEAEGFARSTVHRFLSSNGLMKQNQITAEDRRRFEAELPNDLWQSDCMHGPKVDHQGKNRKTCNFSISPGRIRILCFYLFEITGAAT